jgi:hypothetical protein
LIRRDYSSVLRFFRSRVSNLGEPRYAALPIYRLRTRSLGTATEAYIRHLAVHLLAIAIE